MSESDDDFWCPDDVDPRPVTCKFCGERPLYWSAYADGAWRLVDDDGARHYGSTPATLFPKDML